MLECLRSKSTSKSDRVHSHVKSRVRCVWRHHTECEWSHTRPHAVVRVGTALSD